MYALYRDGATLKEVGARFDLSSERVRQIFRSAGLPTRSTAESVAIQSHHLASERREEICTAFADSKDLDEVARRLRVKRGVVKGVVESHFSKAELRRPKATPQTYTDEELIAFLREASGHVRGPLSIKTYSRYAQGRRTRDGRPWPTHQTHAKRFGGSWRAAVQAAGLAVNPPAPMRTHRVFDEAQCVEAIRTAARQLGKVPTAAEYFTFAKASNGTLPSQATVRKRLGTWYEALARAGI